MKKLFTVLLLITAFVGFASAKIVTPPFVPTESEKDFDVAYYIPESLTPYDVPEEYQDEMSVTQAFKTTNNGVEGEIRYSLFTQTEECDYLQVCMYEQVIIMNIAENARVKELPTLGKSGADKKLFNGMQTSVFLIAYANSKFSKGYKFMLVEIFFKKGQGICVRSFLFNDTKFIGVEDEKPIPDSDFMKNYACFKFMDKDKDGNYIKPNK